MKTRAFTSILALLLLGAATMYSAHAQTASGSYQFSFEDGYTKTLDFDASMQPDGSASGQMTLTDEATIYFKDVDGTGVEEEKVPGFYLKADFDTMAVNKNQAVMSGVVKDSSLRDLIGRRVLLTVED
ncbi:MAG TPA: hypothetical protein VJT09_18960, partial [Pyrinomonadaceae bacterium]|nr:hypothetical protein [Pyrinomonadaceae bacterium]